MGGGGGGGAAAGGAATEDLGTTNNPSVALLRELCGSTAGSGVAVPGCFGRH